MKSDKYIGFCVEFGEMRPTQADARAVKQDCTQAFHGSYKPDQQERTIRKFLSDDYNGWY